MDALDFAKVADQVRFLARTLPESRPRGVTGARRLGKADAQVRLLPGACPDRCTRDVTGAYRPRSAVVRVRLPPGAWIGDGTQASVVKWYHAILPRWTRGFDPRRTLSANMTRCANWYSGQLQSLAFVGSTPTRVTRLNAFVVVTEARHSSKVDARVRLPPNALMGWITLLWSNRLNSPPCHGGDYGFDSRQERCRMSARCANW